MNKNYDVYSYLEELKQSKADKTKDKTKGDFGGCDLGATPFPWFLVLTSRLDCGAV